MQIGNVTLDIDRRHKARRCDVCRRVVGYLVPDQYGSNHAWHPKDNFAGFTASGHGYRCLDHAIIPYVDDDYLPFGAPR